MRRELVEKSKNYATRAHKRIDQRRKYSNQPYDVHLEAVAKLVGSVVDDEEMIAAAWLHDVVEDTPATLGDIEREFGKSISILVGELTDVSRPSDGNRAARKARDRHHLANASVRAKSIKLADLIDNCRDITRHDTRFAPVYLEEMRSLLDVLGGGDSRLYRMAQDAYEKGVLKIQDSNRNPADEPETSRRDGLLSPSEQVQLRKLFFGMFSAKDIADPLLSFDAETSSSDLRKAFQAYNQRVATVRIHGAVRGYILASDLEDKTSTACAEHLRHFAPSQLASSDAAISDTIRILTVHDYCFVQALGDVIGVVTRNCINKPYVRMWLFGAVTIYEMKLTEKIRQLYPADEWRTLMSEQRFKKAQDLQAERNRRNQECGLLDCLQLSDKALILLRSPHLDEFFDLKSKSAGKQIIKEIEQLRDHLAHAQDIASHDWPQIVRITERVEELGVK